MFFEPANIEYVANLAMILFVISWFVLLTLAIIYGRRAQKYLMEIRDELEELRAYLEDLRDNFPTRALGFLKTTVQDNNEETAELVGVTAIGLILRKILASLRNMMSGKN